MTEKYSLGLIGVFFDLPWLDVTWYWACEDLAVGWTELHHCQLDVAQQCHPPEKCHDFTTGKQQIKT